jgi:hypothetical protein
MCISLICKDNAGRVPKSQGVLGAAGGVARYIRRFLDRVMQRVCCSLLYVMRCLFALIVVVL